MRILITTDFFYEFELIETDNAQNAINYIKSNGEENENIKVLGFHDTLTTEEARKNADLILYITDYIN